jgi:hypothetical protein
LIDAALKAGNLNLETATLLKAQAVTGDPAFPAQYRGRGLGNDSQRMIDDVQLNIASLSAGGQARVRSYLLPPSVSESWYMQHMMGGQGLRTAAVPLTWKTINTANGKAKIWYHPEIAGQAVRAQQIAAEIDGRIWQKLVELFGRDLPPDCGASCMGGGGDARTDIYLIDRPNEWSAGGGAGTTYVNLGHGSTMSKVTWALANSWVDSIPVADEAEYGWLKYATSAYAMHYVYPTANEEH